MDFTVRYALRQGSKILKENGIKTHRLDSELILSSVLKKNLTYILTNPDRVISSVENSDYISLIERRSKREPLAYIFNEKEFWSLRLEVTKDTLVPRPETETLVQEALEALNEIQSHKSLPIKALDIGTGSGNIPISIASEINEIQFIAIDISRKGLEVAKCNTRKHNTEKKISFILADLLSPPFIKGVFDIILSNPPYIRTDDIASLMPEVGRFEPINALDGGDDGLFYYRKILAQYPDMLISGGKLIFEIGYDQAKDVSALISNQGLFNDIKIIKDLSGSDRVIVAEKR